MAAQSRLWAGHDFGARTAPTAVERVLRRFQRHLVTASVPWRIRARRIGSWRRISAALIGAFAGTLLLTPPAFAVDAGSLDAAFTTANGTGANSDVRSIAVQADQKIIIGGDFTTWNGAAVGRVVRLTTGGTRDTAFTTNIGTGANAFVYSVVVQADQKIILGGGLTSWDGTTVGRSVRLNANGARDTSFTTTTGTGANGTVWSVAVQADQRILVVGDFTTWNGAIVSRVVRLNTDGGLDPAYTTSTGTGANESVRSLAVQTNQQALIGGAFTSWNTAAVGRFLRLNGTAATGSQSQVVVLRAPVIQQFGRPLTVTCDTAASESLNWWGVASGGWSQSWATWMNDGRGGAVCTRTLRYSTVQSQWVVE